MKFGDERIVSLGTGIPERKQEKTKQTVQFSEELLPWNLVIQKSSLYKRYQKSSVLLQLLFEDVI